MPGDNDPIDVLDIGAKQLRTGEIVAVKILGVLALIDDGETDWKILAISISDAMAHMLNDIDDVETHLPGTIKAIREYMTPHTPHSPHTTPHTHPTHEHLAADYIAQPQPRAILAYPSNHHAYCSSLLMGVAPLAPLSCRYFRG